MIEAMRWQGWNNPVLRRELRRVQFGRRWGWKVWLSICLSILIAVALIGATIGLLIALALKEIDMPPLLYNSFTAQPLP